MDDKACEVYSAAQENGLFLSFHTGLHWHRIADYQPLLFDEVAWNFPRLKFSMEHVGGYHFFARRWRSSATTITARAIRGAYTRA